MESKGLQVVQSGERTNTEGKPVSNLILLSISDSDYSSLRPHLEYVSLPNHLVLHEGGGKLEFAYFPNRGLISLVVVMKDGKTAEAGIVGNEGFTGTPAAVGLSRSPLQAVVQITGDGFRVEVGALQNALESTPHLQLLLSRYAVVQGMQVAQTAACNRLHGIEQRLVRWLLMTQDRVDSESLPITRDLYYRLKRAPAQANRRRCSCKALVANDAGFGGLSVFHYDYKRNQTSIREISKFQLSTALVKD